MWKFMHGAQAHPVHLVRPVSLRMVGEISGYGGVCRIWYRLNYIYIWSRPAKQLSAFDPFFSLDLRSHIWMKTSRSAWKRIVILICTSAQLFLLHKVICWLLLRTGFSRFRCVYKQMLRWFPRFQVATTCFSCSPPDWNLVVTNFMFCLHVK